MLIELFIKYIRYELNYSACTVLSYNNDLNQFKEFLTDGKRDFDAHSVTSNDVRAWLASMVMGGCSMRTVKRKLQAVRAFYKYLMRVGEMEVNPAAEVETAKAPKRLPDFIKTENIENLFESPCENNDFEQVRNRLIMLMLYSTGIRRGELVALRDVDVTKNELKVRGKRNKDRIVPFGMELNEEITKYRTIRAEQVGGETEMFFVRNNGEPIYPTLVYRLVHKELNEAGGCSRCSPHVLRHTFASTMLNNGARLNSVKELLGHESLAATQVYTHITYRELKSNYEHAHPRALKKGG